MDVVKTMQKIVHLVEEMLKKPDEANYALR